jgi:hypothetical protein
LNGFIRNERFYYDPDRQQCHETTKSLLAIKFLEALNILVRISRMQNFREKVILYKLLVFTESSCNRSGIDTRCCNKSPDLEGAIYDARLLAAINNKSGLEIRNLWRANLNGSSKNKRDARYATKRHEIKQIARK